MLLSPDMATMLTLISLRQPLMRCFSRRHTLRHFRHYYAVSRLRYFHYPYAMLIRLYADADAFALLLPDAYDAAAASLPPCC